MKLKSILLADSMFTSRSSLKRIIEEHGFTVVAETEDVQTTVERYAELHPDIIIVNSSLPNLNGYDILRVLESSHPGLNAIIIYAAHNEMEPKAIVAKQSKVYILSPFSLTKLPDVLNNFYTTID